MIKKLFFAALVSFSSVAFVFGQGTVAASSVEITPDARSAGMGDAGVALRPGANSIFHNTAGISFSDYTTEVSVGYTPWMHQYADDGEGGNLFSLGGFYKINPRHSVGLGVRYFMNGKIFNSDNSTVSPADILVDLGYAFRIGESMSVSANGRYVNSSLNNDLSGSAFGLDLGFNYRQRGLSAAFTLRNVGSKVSYGPGSASVSMPAAAVAGVGYEYALAAKHLLTGSLQLDYSFLPSDSSYFGGGLGVEYMYDRMLAARVGYRYAGGEFDPLNNYVTVGLGFYYSALVLDASYLIDLGDSPLKNTWRVSLGVRF